MARIGRRNAEIGERNRAMQATRAALVMARWALDGLERGAAADRARRGPDYRGQESARGRR